MAMIMQAIKEYQRAKTKERNSIPWYKKQGMIYDLNNNTC
jgi:hypothetical protein